MRHNHQLTNTLCLTPQAIGSLPEVDSPTLFSLPANIGRAAQQVHGKKVCDVCVVCVLCVCYCMCVCLQTSVVQRSRFMAKMFVLCVVRARVVANANANPSYHQSYQSLQVVLSLKAMSLASSTSTVFNSAQWQAQLGPLLRLWDTLMTQVRRCCLCS